jgi:hypothetical protein
MKPLSILSAQPEQDVQPQPQYQAQQQTSVDPRDVAQIMFWVLLILTIIGSFSFASIAFWVFIIEAGFTDPTQIF